MPRIPEFGNDRLSGARNSLPGVDTRSGIGEFSSIVSDVMVQNQRENNQLNYQNALLSLQEFSNKELNDPETGYKNLQGERALTEAPKYNQRYVTKLNEIRSSLKNNPLLDKFDIQSKAMQIGYTRQIMDHQSRAQASVATNTIQSGINLSLAEAQSLYHDPMSLDLGYKNIASRVAEFADAHGVPEEQKKLQLDTIKQGYFSSSLDGWIANTEVNGNSFTSLAKDMKNSFAFKQLTEVNQAKYLLKVDALIKRQHNQNSDNLKLDLTNAWQMQVRGIQAPPVTLERFKSVYGEEGKKAYDDYQDRQVMARNISVMQGLPTSDLTGYLTEKINSETDNLSANTSDENFAQRLNLQNVQRQAAMQIMKLRQSDPILAAYQAGEVEQLDTANLQESLAKRASQVDRISQSYGTPLKFLSKAEADHVSQIIDSSGPVQQSLLLNQFIEASGDNDNAYQALLDQIGLKNSAFSVAGTILHNKNNSVTTKTNWFSANETADGTLVASTILKGASALKTTKERKGLSVPGKALESFDDLTQDIFTDDSNARQSLYNATMAYYTGKVIESGNYEETKELNTGLLEESVNAVVGDVNSRFGVRMPWGMDESDFNQNLESELKNIAIQNKWLKSDVSSINATLEINSIFNDRFSLVPINYSSGLATGQYLIKAGSGFLSDNENKPVVIDILSGQKSIETIPK